VVRADATTYRVPDDVTVVFLYNPFRGDVLQAALTRVLESFDRAPRRLRVVYANPRDHELIVAMQRFKIAYTIWLSWRPEAEWHRTKVAHVYEVEPPEHAMQAPSAHAMLCPVESSKMSRG
jgi:hypothetical protein